MIDRHYFSGVTSWVAFVKLPFCYILLVSFAKGFPNLKVVAILCYNAFQFYLEFVSLCKPSSSCIVLGIFYMTMHHS